MGVIGVEVVVGVWIEIGVIVGVVIMIGVGWGWLGWLISVVFLIVFSVWCVSM